MTLGVLARRRERATGRRLRVGLFGLLGSGNLGNDGSAEAVLAYLRSEHPDASLDFFCAGPQQVAARYGLPASPLNWNSAEYQTASRLSAVARKVLGKAVDAFRTAAWVRRHDVVIVPGMGVLEATLPLRPWGFPYSLLLLCAAGRLLGTKVALVSVGSDVIDQRATRLVITTAARLAAYRSYRDHLSRDAMRRMGVDASADEVYPDLAFALPAPSDGEPGNPPGRGVVGVGVMAYRGGNADRARAEEIYTAYVDKMKRFVRWLVDNGRQVRLFTGDHMDQAVVDEIRAAVPSGVTAASASNLDDLMREMSAVDSVAAVRYHNVLSALKLCKPTISIGYAAKNDVLMADMGVGQFCQSVARLDVDRLIEQFTALESRAPALRQTLAVRNAENVQRLKHQFAALNSALFPAEHQTLDRGVR